jgi:hypothetical protein
VQQQCNIPVTQLLVSGFTPSPQCVRVVLKRCYSGVAVVLQRCYNVLQRPSSICWSPDSCLVAAVCLSAVCCLLSAVSCLLSTLLSSVFRLLSTVSCLLSCWCFKFYLVVCLFVGSSSCLAVSLAVVSVVEVYKLFSHVRTRCRGVGTVRCAYIIMGASRCFLCDHQTKRGEHKTPNFFCVELTLKHALLSLNFGMFTLLLHCCYIFVTLLLHCCHTIVILSLHFRNCVGKIFLRLRSMPNTCIAFRPQSEASTTQNVLLVGNYSSLEHSRRIL